MSEYQYYEFAAIDRALSEEEIDELGRLSSRAKITPTSFVNEYQFGSFRGNPLKLMEKYFDAFLYMAKWGTHRLMFRLPKRHFDVKRAEKFCDAERLSLHKAGEYVVVAFDFHEEEGEWVETQGRLRGLLPLREDLLSGDLRCLYLAWLRGVEIREVDEDAVEPPLPPGLGKLSAPLRNFADFIWLDCDLIAAAAAGDDRPPPEALQEQEHDPAAWLATAPATVKDAWLRRVFAGEFAPVRLEMKSAFHAAQKKKSPQVKSEKKSRGRTARQLLEAQATIAAERIAREQKQADQRMDRLEREKAAAQEGRLAKLARRESAAWQDVDKLVAAGDVAAYDQAVEMLDDLCTLAARNGRIDAAHARLKDFRRRYLGRTALMRRLKAANLIARKG